ncbi:hypothetical protein [Bifidobacterium saguinibicoloris]|uniref:hypothetical protein n=1 Tax=Bifidobacterium saguinibicoloris TaxID=2834433 RepID=UPI001C56C67C|nr:hypothetical protein [Bifidobacterium saguinibicoloris]MBW3080154.1 hypothetical protein [Bifidobacterium saguinibicoloris]
MPWINDSEFTHASVCMAQRDQHGYIDNLIRLLDYRQDLSGAKSYAWVYRDDGHETRTNPEDPRTLYRQETLEAMHESGEDFLFVKWKPNTSKPERPQLRDPYTRPYSFVPAYYEVINSPANSLQELRENLQDGWAYSGKPTRRVLIIYAEKGDKLDTVLLNRDDLSFSGNQIRLKLSAPLGATRYKLSTSDVKYLPENPWTNGYRRAIYTSFLLPRAGDRMLIQPLSRYALRYIRWYADNVLDLAPQSDGQRLVEVVKQAFQSPERLDEFGTMLSPMDTQRLRKTISRFIADDNQMVKLVKDVLSSDTAFKQACITECQQDALQDLDAERTKQQAQLYAEIGVQKQELGKLIQQQRDELAQLEERIRERSASYERLGKLVSPLQAEADKLEKEVETARAAITSIHKQQEAELAKFTQRKESELAELEQRKTAELATLEQQKQAVLARLDEDVALRLGLKSAVESVVSAQTAHGTTNNAESTESIPHPTAIPYPTLSTSSPQNGTAFTHVLAENLRAFGIIQPDKPKAAPKELAGICAPVLSATRFLAMDSTFAADFANALSYAMHGEPAYHATVPADWHDARALDQLLTKTRDRMLVLDDVFDTVNESLLFALSRLHPTPTIILPIGAYGNLRLLAAEVWDHVFYMPTEQYVKLSAMPTSMHQSTNPPHHSDSPDQLIIDTATSMQDNVSLPMSSLMLPASVSARFALKSGARRCVSAHLALQTYAAFGMEQARTLRIDGKEPPFVKELLSRIERGRHGR